MTQCNRASHGVHLGGVKAQGVHHRQRLSGKGFVQFKPVNVLVVNAGITQRSRNGFNGANAHDLWRNTARGKAYKTRQRGQPKLLDSFFAGQNQCACAIAGLRRVTSRDRSACRKHRAQFAQGFQRGVRAWAFVQIHRARLGHHFTSGQIGHAIDDVKRCDFVGELTRLLRLDGTQVRLQRKRILLLTADLPLLRYLLSGQPHAIGNAHVFIACKHLGVERWLVAAHGHHAHGFSATSDQHIGLAHTNAVSRHLDGRHAGCAKAVHRNTANRVIKRQPNSDTRHVHALLPLGERTADDGVFNGLRVQRRHLQHGRLHGCHQQIIGTGIFKVTAARTTNRGACCGNDVRVLYLFHFLIFQ